jgi:hypothetical protein
MTSYGSFEAVRVAVPGSVTRHRLASQADTLAVTANEDVHYISLTATGTDGLYTLAMASGPFGGPPTTATAPPIAAPLPLIGHVHLTDARKTYGHRVAIDRRLIAYNPDIVPDVNTAVAAGNGQIWFTGSGAILHTD